MAYKFPAMYNISILLKMCPLDKRQLPSFLL